MSFRHNTIKILRYPGNNQHLLARGYFLFVLVIVSMPMVLIAPHLAKTLSLESNASTKNPAIAGDIENTSKQHLLPLTFIPNRGQTHPQVRFQSHNRWGHLFFMSDGVVLSLSDSNNMFQVHFVGTNANTQIVPTHPLPGVANYLVGNHPSQWQTHIPIYSTITYRALYPGIDLEYHGSAGMLKGTYIVAPGANPDLIRWQYMAHAQVMIDDQTGTLAITSTSSDQASNPMTLTEHAPIAWQDIEDQHIRIGVRYEMVADGTIGFVVDDYNQHYPLIVDPSLEYSTYLGGNGGENGLAITVDREGYIYIAGWTRSPDFPLAHPLQPSTGGPQNGFMSKITPDGQTLVYSTYLGGSGDDTIRGIAVDTQGNVVVTGATKSKDFLLSKPLQNIFGGGARDAYVAKLNATGDDLIYSTYLGGNEDDEGNDVALDDQGNAYVLGHTFSTNFPVAQAYQSSNAGGSDVFITKLHPDGSNIRYSSYLGGSQDDQGWGIAVGKDQRIYVTGLAGSKDFPVVNAFQPTHRGGGRDAFVTSLSADGASLMYSTYLGGNQEEDEDSGNIAVDLSGQVTVAGWTNSGDFPNVRAFQSKNAGGWDVFVSKLQSDGRGPIYSTYLGGSGDDGAYSLASDSSGNAYLVGWTGSHDFPTLNAIQPEMKGGELDTFIAKVDATGNQLLYSTYFGGSNDDVAWDVAADDAGNVYMGGQTWSADFPVLNAIQPDFVNSTDVVVVKVGTSELVPSFINPRLNRFVKDNLLLLLTGTSLLISVVRIIAWRIRNQRSSVKANPYIAGPPIDNPEMFFGREKLLNDIVQGIFHNHIALEGPRRMGKSSLLIRLAQILRDRQEYIRFIPVIVDCQRIEEEEFFLKWMRALLKAVYDVYPSLILPHLLLSKEGAIYDDQDFEDDLELILNGIANIEQRDVRVIVLIDEGDCINQYRVETQGKIRSILSNNTLLKMVWVGVNILKSRSSVDSPWYNMLVSYTLTPLAEREAIQLITKPAKKVGYTYQPDAIESILTYTACNPYTIQSVCFHALNSAQSEKRFRVRKADIEQALRYTENESLN